MFRLPQTFLSGYLENPSPLKKTCANINYQVFGNGAFVKRGLKVLIAMSAFGNIIAVTYTNSRVKQEIAKLRILPFSRYWARESPYHTPVGALTLHWIFTAIIIIASK